MPTVSRSRPSVAPVVQSGSRADTVFNALLADIHRGVFVPGDFLPSVRDLAARFEMSISPVVRAMERLTKEGWVERIHGSGVRLIRGPETTSRVPLPLVVIPAVRAHIERAALGETLDESNGKSRPENWLRRHVSYASQEWVIHKLLHQTGIRIQLSPLEDEGAEGSFEARLKEMLEAPPNAFCFVTPEHLSDEALRLMRRLAKHQTTIAYLVSERDVSDFDRVISDFTSGQYALTQYLLEQGHKSIVRLSVGLERDWEARKQRGFVRALGEVGQSEKEAARRCLEFGEIVGSGAEVVGRAVRFIGDALDQFQPTAIMAVNDSHAALVRVALRFLSRMDVLVTGYDNMWAELDEPDPFRLGTLAGSFPEDVARENPPITVERNLPLAGASLAKLVVDRLNSALPKEPQTVLIPQQLVVP